MNETKQFRKTGGATYCRNEYGVYRYDTFPRSSVLAGQERRQFLDTFPTQEEAQAHYPTATLEGCGYHAPYLNHLPGEDDPDPMGDWPNETDGGMD